MFPFFFFNDTATTEIYTLSLHDALPIWRRMASASQRTIRRPPGGRRSWSRSEEHTSELQSRLHLVCRLLLEKKKKAERRDQDDTDSLAAHVVHPQLLCREQPPHPHPTRR